MMNKYNRQGSNSEIGRIFTANSVMDCLGYPVLLINMTLNNFYFPMSQHFYGKIGCLVIVHFLDSYVRYYSQFFPLAVALIR